MGVASGLAGRAVVPFLGWCLKKICPGTSSSQQGFLLGKKSERATKFRSQEVLILQIKGSKQHSIKMGGKTMKCMNSNAQLWNWTSLCCKPVSCQVPGGGGENERRRVWLQFCIFNLLLHVCFKGWWRQLPCLSGKSTARRLYARTIWKVSFGYACGLRSTLCWDAEKEKTASQVWKMCQCLPQAPEQFFPIHCQSFQRVSPSNLKEKNLVS